MNVKKGSLGNLAVFEAIHDIVAEAIVGESQNTIELIKAARRRVLIEFAPDPDIILREKIGEDVYRNVIAIEVKGGTDYSNIHNRIGEAEKSHQKAKAQGYVECWTIINVPNLDREVAKKESPSTNRFYALGAIVEKEGSEYEDFRSRVISLAGIA